MIKNIKLIGGDNNVFHISLNDIIIKVVDKKEMNVLKKLKEIKLPNVVEIFDICAYNKFKEKYDCDLCNYVLIKEEESVYSSKYVIIMEKLDIYSEDILKNESVEYKENFFEQLRKGIDQIHSNNIYHGDVKLQNIGHINNIVKIFDFGNSVYYDNIDKNKQKDIDDVNDMKNKYIDYF